MQKKSWFDYHVKSTAHFRADYEPIAKEIIEVGTPGLLSPDLSIFDYKKSNAPFGQLIKINSK